MSINQIRIQNVDKVQMVGDQVLVKALKPQETTPSGLYLPPSVHQKEALQSGYIIKIGPGYPIPQTDIEAPWKEKHEEPKYVALQAKEGDLAVFIQNRAYELSIAGEKYLMISHNSILMLVRDDKLF